MPFYDAWTQAQFLAALRARDGDDHDQYVDPASYPDEVAFLPAVIGNFTDAMMTFVRATHADVPVRSAVSDGCESDGVQSGDQLSGGVVDAVGADVSEDGKLRIHAWRAIWTRAEQTIDFGQALGFPATQRSHLVGIGDATTAWMKEVADRGRARDLRAWCCSRWINSA